MSGLEIFEELRFMIELLAAELMFIYYFAKKKGRYNIRMVCIAITFVNAFYETMF